MNEIHASIILRFLTLFSKIVQWIQEKVTIAIKKNLLYERTPLQFALMML